MLGRLARNMILFWAVPAVCFYVVGVTRSWSVWVSVLQINKLDFIGSSKDEHVLGNECVIIRFTKA